MESGKNTAIDKKTYEIGYALWRVADGSSERIFAETMRSKAMKIIAFAADREYAELNAVLDALHAVIKFSVDVNCVTIGNAAILVREIGNLKMIIAGNYTGVDISNMFDPETIPTSGAVGVVSGSGLGGGTIEDFRDVESVESEFAEIGNKSEIRQSAILERIRQNGDCRLGDILAVLPEVSERTIRYDLESLVQRGIIERLGTGGRSTYYRLKSTQ
jgi:hypothetical protein